MKTARALLFAAPLALAGFVLACEDPPPPTLSQVAIDRTSNPHATSLTYIQADPAGDPNHLIADASKGIILGDGLSVLLTFNRTISNPPDDNAKATALENKAFTFKIQGDVFDIYPTKLSVSDIIIESIHPGQGALVISVDGAQGAITMPVNVVDQAAVPPDTRPPTAPPETTTDDDAGSSTPSADAAPE